MKTRGMQIWFGLLIVMALAAGTLGPVAARDAQPQRADEPVLLRLKYATFDPLQGAPQIDSALLRADAYPGTGEGAYIVQFRGPVEGAWKGQIQALGGRVMDYLPDYAFLVWMDSAVQKRVAALEAVRWVGLYQPAYKLSPNLDRSKPLYRVVLFEGADLGAVAARLADLNTPAREVPGEQFTLLLPEGGVDEVATWPEVLWIENRPLYRVSNNIATGIMDANTAWGNSYTGTGQMVTVADTGIDTGVDNSTMHDDFEGRFAQISSWPVDPSLVGCASNAGADDGADDVNSGHGTHVLGSVLGNGARSSGTIKGTAYQAVPSFQAVEQYTTFTTSCKSQGYYDGYWLTGLPGDLKDLFQEAYNWGSRIHSNSWGAPVYGEYTPNSQAVDEFVWDHPDMLILFSAGNMGTDEKSPLGYVDEDSLDAPGTAKNALTVGASDNFRSSGGIQMTWGALSSYMPGNNWLNLPTSADYVSDNSGELAAFSSRGPANDGRRKPDVVAPGTNILSTRSSVAVGPESGGWGAYNDYYLYMGGTSMATPLTAGAAALVRQYYVQGRGHTTPSAALIKATLINSAVDIAGYGVTNQEAGLPIPNNHEGWGRVDVGAATSGYRYFEDGDSVQTGTHVSYTYDVTSSSKPFRVTLVWSDYPGSPSAGGLVNDLDLEVIAPGGGTTYLGNDFSGGWSVTGGTADSINNVESVYVQNPTVGQWTVRVDGTNVPASGNQQPFAVVVTGYFGEPPSAAFSGTPTSGEAPLEVSFTDESTGDITNWAWDFGDLGSSTAPSPNHTYVNPGDYTVSLTVTGPAGTDTETKTGYIHATEPTSLAVDHASGAPGGYFVFTGQNFTPSSDATLSINGTDLVQTVPTNETGSVEFALDTENLSPGTYFVTVRTNPSASTYFKLDPSATLWPDPVVDPTILVPGTVGPPQSVHLPVVIRYYPARDPIVNGDFEDGPWVGWIEDSSHNLTVVMKDGFFIEPHSGIWLAWLGGFEDETAYIEQTITVPAGRAYLHYWHWISSSNTNCGMEQAVFTVNGTEVRTYDLCSLTRTWGWAEESVDLSAYVGQPASLQFEATVDENASSWYIDDVSFQVTAAKSDAGIPVAPDPAISNARKTKTAPGAPTP